MPGHNAYLTRSFLIKSPSRCIASCQQHIKLDQFSQQNAHCRTAFLQNRSLGASNYNITIDILKGRFGQRRIILNSHIDILTLFDIGKRLRGGS